MARSAASAVISTLRTLIGDSDSATRVWTDEDLQASLDACRHDVRYEELQPVPTIAAGGTVTYMQHRSCLACWETDVVLQDASFNALTPAAATTDYALGIFGFATHQPLVFATGIAHDVYGAAAEILTRWAASESIKVDYDSQGISDTWKQKQSNLLDMADRYRQMAWSGSVKMRRG